jgi:hypothetical protein
MIIGNNKRVLSEKNSHIIPKWIIHHVFYSSEKRTLPYMRLLFCMFDFRPNLIKERFLFRRRQQKENIPLIGHIHVPKTGGTYTNSLQETLPHINFSHVLVRSTQADYSCPVGLTTIKKNKLNSFFLFSTVRNPLSFFVSYYHHAQGFGNYVNRNHYDYAAAQKGFDYLMQTIMNRSDKWPSRKFVFPQLFDQDGKCIIDWVNRNETLDADLNALCEYFGLNFSPGSKQRVSPKNKRWEEYYSDKLLHEVSLLYSREMKLFGYSGPDVVMPYIQTMPMQKARVTYKYVPDELVIDGLILSNKEPE